MSVTVAIPRATHADLARVDGKAELIDGKVVSLMATGYRPGIVAARILRRLSEHVDVLGHGIAFGDNIGFVIPEISTGRESFSPDAAYYSGPAPTNEMKFVPGPPDFAVEVRSEGDYGPAAELALAEKRAEYFEAGTLVVWDVDPVGRTVRSYRSGKAAAATFGAGAQANAEPAVQGWSVSVDWLMA